jgi:hypothetical protein
MRIQPPFFAKQPLLAVEQELNHSLVKSWLHRG